MAKRLLGEQADRFIDRLHRRLSAAATGDDDLSQEVRSVLGVWPGPRTSPPKTAAHLLPAAEHHFEAALSLGESGADAALCAALRPLSPFLPWTYGYPEHPLYSGLPDLVAFAQIAGRNDLRNAESILIGLTLIAPRTLYPPHTHPAVELYLPIAGTGLWTQGGEPANPYPPGTTILHPGNVAHATEATSKPVLAIYTWRGDLKTPPSFIL